MKKNFFLFISFSLFLSSFVSAQIVKNEAVTKRMVWNPFAVCQHHAYEFKNMYGHIVNELKKKGGDAVSDSAFNLWVNEVFNENELTPEEFGEGLDTWLNKYDVGGITHDVIVYYDGINPIIRVRFFYRSECRVFGLYLKKFKYKIFGE